MPKPISTTTPGRSRTWPRRPNVGRFRYIDRKQLDFSRLTSESLRVGNDGDAELGTFDGLVISASTTTPRYIVVDARGLFSGRRYLLPVGRVRYDEAARILRVNLPREIAERYPEFDRDQFETMTDDAMRGYEARLTECFPRSASGQPADQSTGDGPPEWLMTSVCITVTPGVTGRTGNGVRGVPSEWPDASRESAPAPGRSRGKWTWRLPGRALDVAGPSTSTPQTRNPARLEVIGADGRIGARPLTKR